MNPVPSVNVRKFHEVKPNLKGSVNPKPRKPRGPRRKVANVPVAVLRMEKRLATTVGDGARQARMRAGLTQAELAERIGVATEVYGRMERGRMLPSVPTLFRLCMALRSGPDELMGLGAAHGPPEKSPWADEIPPGLADTPDMRRLLRSLRLMKKAQIKLMYLVSTAILLRH